jgi:hypothetical protein
MYLISVCARRVINHNGKALVRGCINFSNIHHPEITQVHSLNPIISFCYSCLKHRSTSSAYNKLGTHRETKKVCMSFDVLPSYGIIDNHCKYCEVILPATLITLGLFPIPLSRKRKRIYMYHQVFKILITYTYNSYFHTC